MSSLKETQRLLKVVHQLRQKCPWDSKQTHKTLAPHLLEEAYETLEAIDKRSPKMLKEELGDLLLQVVLHAEISSEKKHFNFEQVAKAIADKMIFRHPHIFQKKAYKDYKSHMKTWTSMKTKENPKKFVLEGIPRALPSLQLSQRYGEIASTVGFDWDNAKQVLNKVKEEIKELEQELKRKRQRPEAISMELGDVFFALSNLSRHLQINAEDCAKQSALKFSKRFTEMEKIKRKEGKKLTDCDLEELEKTWQRIKKS